MKGKSVTIATDSWRRIEYLETPALLARVYKKKHGRDLKTAKAQEIVANLLQARRYFEAASTSDSSVKPLLLYYGVLAASRAAILYCNFSFRESSLSQSHGLSIVGNMCKASQFWPFDMQSRANSGTFAELLRIGSEVTTVEYDEETKSPVVVTRPLLNSPTPAGQFAFSDVLETCHLSYPIGRAYHEVCDRRPRHVNAKIEGNVLRFTNYDISPDLIREAFQFAPEAHLVKETFGVTATGGGWRPFAFRPPKEPQLVDTARPWLGELSSGFLDGRTTIFTVAFFLGMAARYYPTRWLALISRQGDSVSYPIVTLLLDWIEDETPAMLYRTFAGSGLQAFAKPN
jgi:hypothetical protein